jgi:hypothetical protein
MTDAERINAVGELGFTPRQAAFLVTVALHSGVCLARHYGDFAGVAWGQAVRDFIAMLVNRGSRPSALVGARSRACITSRTR